MFIKQFSVEQGAIHLPLPPPAKHTHQEVMHLGHNAAASGSVLKRTHTRWVISAAFKADLYSVVVKLLDSANTHSK